MYSPEAIKLKNLKLVVEVKLDKEIGKYEREIAMSQDMGRIYTKYYNKLLELRRDAGKRIDDEIMLCGSFKNKFGDDQKVYSKCITVLQGNKVDICSKHDRELEDVKVRMAGAKKVYDSYSAHVASIKKFKGMLFEKFDEEIANLESGKGDYDLFMQNFNTVMRSNAKLLGAEEAK